VFEYGGALYACGHANNSPGTLPWMPHPHDFNDDNPTFVVEPQLVYGMWCMLKSTDGGATWTIPDINNRPFYYGNPTNTGNPPFQGVTWRRFGNKIYFTMIEWGEYLNVTPTPWEYNDGYLLLGSYDLTTDAYSTPPTAIGQFFDTGWFVAGQGSAAPPCVLLWPVTQNGTTIRLIGYDQDNNADIPSTSTPNPDAGKSRLLALDNVAGTWGSTVDITPAALVWPAWQIQDVRIMEVDSSGIVHLIVLAHKSTPSSTFSRWYMRVHPDLSVTDVTDITALGGLGRWFGPPLFAGSDLLVPASDMVNVAGIIRVANYATTPVLTFEAIDVSVLTFLGSMAVLVNPSGGLIAFFGGGLAGTIDSVFYSTNTGSGWSAAVVFYDGSADFPSLGSTMSVVMLSNGDFGLIMLDAFNRSVYISGNLSTPIPPFPPVFAGCDNALAGDTSLYARSKENPTSLHMARIARPLAARSRENRIVSASQNFPKKTTRPTTRAVRRHVLTTSTFNPSSFSKRWRWTVLHAAVVTEDHADFPVWFRHLAGMCDTDGDRVYVVAGPSTLGDLFPQWLTGCQISINGAIYVVASVDNTYEISMGPGHEIALTLTTSAGTQTNVPWHDSCELRHVSYGGQVNDITGKDIVFTDDNDNIIPYESVWYDPPTGKYEFHALRSISHSAPDTEIRQYWGGPATDQSNKRALWATRYGGVWHGGRPTDSVLDLSDSTGNGNNGVNHGASVSPGFLGIAGGGIMFTAPGQYIELGNVVAPGVQLPSAFTLQAMILWPFNVANQMLWDNKDATGGAQWLAAQVATRMAFGVYSATTSASIYAANMTGPYPRIVNSAWGNFYAVAGCPGGVIHGTDTLHMLLYDSTPVDSAPLGWGDGPNWGSGTGPTVGPGKSVATISAPVAPFPDGVQPNAAIDEIRLVNVPLTGGWIATEVINTGHTPSFFGRVGPETPPAPPPPPVTGKGCLSTPLYSRSKESS
jgi:hypothetical protein